MSTARSQRNANIELLRILSMLMVTMLHALGKSDLLRPMEPSLSANGWIAWIFETLSIGAVNIFMLITGYFLVDSRFKPRRFVSLIMQTVFYSAGAFLVFFALGLLSAEERDIYHVLQYLLPVHMDVFWFITAYITLYMVIPLISAGLKALSAKQLGTVILCLVAYQSLFKTVLPFALAVDDKGYSFLWYLTVALIGAYLKLFGLKHLTASVKGTLLYILSAVLILAEGIVLQLINTRTGRLTDLLRVSYGYNHLLVLTLSLGIFAALVKAKPIGGIASKVICAISPFVLGVYLLQENMVLRYRWQDWFLLRDSFDSPVGTFVFRLLAAVIVMFAAGIAVDFVRSLIFGAVGRIVPKKD